MFIEVVEKIKLEQEEVQKIEAVMELLVKNTPNPNNLPSKVESLFDEAYKDLQRILEYDGLEINYSTKYIDE